MKQCQAQRCLELQLHLRIRVRSLSDMGERLFNTFAAFIDRYENISSMAYLLTIPATEGKEWKSIGAVLVGAIGSGEIHPLVSAYAKLGDAYHTGDTPAFNQQATALHDWFAREQASATKRTGSFATSWGTPPT